MALQILINILIMLAWMLFYNSYTGLDMVVGFLLGTAVIRGVTSLRQEYFYMKRVRAALKLGLVILQELIAGNLFVMRVVLSPKMNIQSGTIAVPTRLKLDIEKALLGLMMSLTPGTMTIEFSSDERYFYIHTLDATDRENAIWRAQNVYEQTILEVTRPDDF